MKTLLAILVCGISFSALADQQEGLLVRFQPDSVIYVYENRGPGTSGNLFTGVIQNVAFINHSKNSIVLNDAIIQTIKNKKVIQSKVVSSSSIKLNAAKFYSYQKQGLLKLYDFQFQTSRYLNDAVLAPSDTVKPGEAVIITHEALLFDEIPDLLKVTIQGRTLKGQPTEASSEIKVVNYQSKNSYIFPLKGRWIAASAPSLTGHHRWASVQEFAFDFIKIGAGLSTFQNAGERLTDYYAYNEPIYAIADGVVVSVSDELQETTDNLKRTNEKEEDYFARVVAHQQELMKKGPQYIYGNHVIIRHANNEYSSYLHLKTGSINLKLGDKIKQGQQIATLGHSGNSTEPHLHFHVSNGGDILYSRSLPIVFSNIQLYPDDNGTIRHLHSGQIINTVD